MKATLAKTVWSPWQLSMCCHSLTMINILFSNFWVNLPEVFWVLGWLLAWFSVLVTTRFSVCRFWIGEYWKLFIIILATWQSTSQLTPGKLTPIFKMHYGSQFPHLIHQSQWVPGRVPIESFHAVNVYISLS